MTGKELLDTIYIKLESYATNLNDTYNDLVENDLDEELEWSANEIMNEKLLVYDLMYKIPKLEKKLEELTKYKRAFEILKRCLRINVQELKGVYFAMGYNTNELLTKEEYELLEELMKSEEIR